jgi:hypothetical protein
MYKFTRSHGSLVSTAVSIMGGSLLTMFSCFISSAANIRAFSFVSCRNAVYVTCIIAFLIAERQKRPAPKGEDTEKKDEEEWQLKDVVFVEDVKSVPAGM